MRRKSQPYSDELNALFGDAAFVEPLFCFSSILLGILFCKTVYDLMKAFSPLYSKIYRQLSQSNKIEWDNRGFSTAHAIVVSGVALYFLFLSDFFDDAVSHVPVVFRSTLFSQIIIGASLGYFFSDLGMILWFYPALGGLEYVAHHLVSAFSLALSLYSGHAQVYIFMVLLTEITTPFVNLRWYLNAAGLKSSKLYLFNGMLLFFSWLIARVLLFLYLFLHMYKHYNQLRKVIVPGFYFLLIAPPFLAFMNIIWFYKILRGLLRTLSKRA